MRHFRDLDLTRLAQTFTDAAKREQELDRILAQLAVDMPGNAEAVAAAGIANRAQINRSASMIELGTAAVDALRRAGWAVVPPLDQRPPLNQLEPTGPAKPIDDGDHPRPVVDDIPDDWAVG